ncbi:MAG: 50S ribosomal protein L28 [Alphaproteobacteria bacterium]|jgi:large subunit ribosomal protein L28|nr:50S ribosomal protein L28 [Alphaproteobacteria bacterium]
MSRVCELTGTRPIVGNNVSHSRVHTKRRFLPNLVKVTLHSETLDQNFPLRIAAKALRTVDKLGGLDAFLAKAKDEQLSDNARKIKRNIQKKAAEAAA